MKWIKVLFFYLPLIISLLNIQAFVSKFLSVSLAQIIAYLNVSLILFGTIFILKKSKPFPKLIKLWFWFFGFYFIFGLLADTIHGNSSPFLKSLIPTIYLLGYSVLLSFPKERLPIAKLLGISFFISCLILIIFNYYNFSLDHDGIYVYTLDRAGGVYGDANNSAVSSILAFIFIKNIFHAKNRLQLIIKVFALLISSYAVLITFSKTGIMVFIFVLIISYQKVFNIKRVVVSLFLIPVFIALILNWANKTEKLSVGQKERIDNVVNVITLQTDKISLSERDLLFRRMLEYIYENPILGNGISFSVSIRGHNTIFGVWADSGLLTFLIFLYLLGKYFKESIFARPLIRNFALPILITLTIFMLSLQTIINQGYLIVVFVLIGYLLNSKSMFNSFNSIEKFGKGSYLKQNNES